MAIKTPPELSGLRILVTRPANRAEALLQALTAAGAVCFHRPLMRIESLREPEHVDTLRRSRSCIMNLDNYRRIIFISVNAVEYGMTLIDEYWPQWPLDLKVYAIGDATAAALQEWGLSCQSAGGAMNSESLLSHEELHSLQHEKVLIVRGLGGREALAENLLERGAQVDYAECYQRKSPIFEHGELRALLVKQQINAVCLNSGETLSYFHQHCPPASCCDGLTLVVPGQRVAQQAAELGYSRVTQAENAGTAATLAALNEMDKRL